MVEVVTFASTLADAGKNRVAAVHLGDVANKLLNDHGFAHAGAAEQTDFAAFQNRTDEVNDFDTRFQNFYFGCLFCKGRRRAMNRQPLASFDFPFSVNRFADDVVHAAKAALAYRYGNRRMRVHDARAATQPIG